MVIREKVIATWAYPSNPVKNFCHDHRSLPVVGRVIAE
jgi:hypothetical protein